MDQFSQMFPGPAGNPAPQSRIEAQAGYFSAGSLRAVDTLQRADELHLQLARQPLGTGFAACREELARGDPAQAAVAAPAARMATDAAVQR